MKHTVRRALFLVMAIGAPWGTVAGQAHLDERWRWVRFGLADGLPARGLSSLATASDGTAWGVGGGQLFHFDRYFWRRIDDTDANTALGDVGFVTASPRGEVVAMHRFAISVWDGARWTVTPLSPEQRGQGLRLTSAVFTGTGQLFVLAIGANAAVPYLLEFRGGAFVPIPWPVSGAGTWGVRLHRGRGDALIATRGGDVWAWSRGAWTVLPSLGPPIANIAAVAFDSTGHPVASLDRPWSEAGLREFTTAGWRFVRALGREHPVRLTYLPDGTGMAIAASGEVVIRERAADWQVFVPRGVDLQSVTDIAASDNGDVWFGTRDGALLWRRSSRRSILWQEPFPDSRNRTNALALDRDSSVVVATAGGVGRLSLDGHLRWLPIPAALRDKALTAVAIDAQRRILVGSGGQVRGLWRLDRDRWSLVRHPALDSSFVHRLETDAHGKVFAVTLPGSAGGTGGVVELDGDSVRAIPIPPLWPGLRVYGISRARDGVEWLATSLGMLRHEGKDWRMIARISGVSETYFYSVVADPSGGVWGGTRSAGVVHLRRDGTLDAHMSSPQQAVFVQDLRFDASGALWASSLDGLWVYADSAWTAVTTDIGLAAPAIWPVLPTPQGLYVGLLGAGLQRLYPALTLETNPTAEFTRVNADEQGIAAEWRVALANGALPPAFLMTRWRVDEGAWSTWSTQRSLRLAVPAGRYRLQVQARTPLGARSKGTASAVIDVLAPVWRRPVVVVPFVALMMGLATLTWIAWRRRQQAERLERRVRDMQRFEAVGVLASGVSHEFNNLLTSILMNLRLIDEPPPDDGSPSPREEIARSAMRAVAYTRELSMFTSDAVLHRRRLDLVEVVQEVLAEFAERVPRPMLPRAVERPANPVLVTLPPQAARAIVASLLDHALESSMPSMPVTVSCDTSRVQSADDGHAISRETFARLRVQWTPSAGQLSQDALARSGQVTMPVAGDRVRLGSAIVTMLAERFGGRVMATRVRGQVRWEVYFRLAEGEEATGAGWGLTTEPGDRPSGEPGADR